MRKYAQRFGFSVFVLCFIASGLCGQEAAAATDKETAAVLQVGKDVQAALTAANATGLGGLKLSKAVLTLETAGTFQAGIKLNFLIFTIDHTQKKGTTISQTLTFGALQKLAGGGNVANLTEPLARALASAAEVASQINVLPLSQGVVKLQFVVEKKTDGSLSYQIMGINLGPSVNLDNTSTNTLEVTFTK